MFAGEPFQLHAHVVPEEAVSKGIIWSAQMVNNGIYYDDICFTRDKDLINGDIIIDDNPEFLDKEDNGIYKVCISAPYNEDFTGYDVRVDSLTDFVEKYKEQLVISLKYE